ncbi:G protein-coupled glucose receptor regulating Gpa2-domain-containing protein [Podospora appendiculata]|uniref:G protein-coupled glucose receptor regulating Gpa2-domain-containing protein n=1 Tax=Podospora appendiculata TaxID=314037 RepID=A0AAE0X6J5_9PEZI|nr:G protein-coupled glucose receptor regulating Gpa2-domain-containing protein [Podospora appendiculata]
MTANTTKNIYDSEDASGSIAPLPLVLSNGLVAVTTFAFLSFLSSIWLFTYLTCRFITWHIRTPRPPERESPTAGTLWEKLPPPNTETFLQRIRRQPPPNQFLMLIYNLLLADTQQATAFLLNVTWISRNALDVGSPVCWAQGWFISTGDLASSLFISAIAVHTYLGVVRGYRLPTWIFYSVIGLLWGFVYGLAVLGVLVTRNGEGRGGLYVRAGAWCWINSAFQDLRLYLHYLWMFISLALTIITYLVIYFHLRLHGTTHKPPTPRSPPTTLTRSLTPQTTPAASQSHHPTFLLYPLLHTLCTAPLAAGRIASMAGNDVPLAYFCLAGAMIASAGWLDVVLYASTRRGLVFPGAVTTPSQDTGPETFAFMRTPRLGGRGFGNVVYVSGGARGDSTSMKLSGVDGKGGRGLWSESWETVVAAEGPGLGAGLAIQCETTTVVTVEEVDVESVGRAL